MKNSILLLAAIATLLLGGCFVPSVNPLYTEKDVAFDPALAGTWGEPNEKERQVFVAEGEKSYRWSAVDKESTNVFRAHLVQLGKERFLDALLARTSDEWKGIGRASVVVRPAHIFFKVQLTNSTLRLDALSVEWVEKLLKEHPQVLAHERLHEPDVADDEQRALLTASTVELQRFVTEHASDTNAFPAGNAFPRVETADPK